MLRDEEVEKQLQDRKILLQNWIKAQSMDKLSEFVMNFKQQHSRDTQEEQMNEEVLNLLLNSKPEALINTVLHAAKIVDFTFSIFTFEDRKIFMYSTLATSMLCDALDAIVIEIARQKEFKEQDELEKLWRNSGA